ncbi:hypothetical protein Rs2_45612 [Raphanus sativus]|nr:hypothetical protein Rs2_45612 [Raphanus sativus]
MALSEAWSKLEALKIFVAYNDHRKCSICYVLTTFAAYLTQLPCFENNQGSMRVKAIKPNLLKFSTPICQRSCCSNGQTCEREDPRNSTDKEKHRGFSMSHR